MDAILQTQMSGQNSAMTPLLNYAESVGMSLDEKRELIREAETSYRNGMVAAGGGMKVK
ncbi:hypothetical protein ACWDX6_25455 [Streptomyces sp. NPDC003027]